MATFSIPIQNKQILFSVCVRIDANHIPKYYQALFDTGAQLTMISARVVKDIGLQPIGAIDITPVSGKPIKTEEYMVRLDIPIKQNVILSGGEIGSRDNLLGKDVNVAKLPYNPVNYDVLIGMDFITLFHITMYNNQFILSN